MSFDLDKLFIEWRVMTPTGIPNIKNPYHLALLKELCIKEGIDKDIVDNVILVLEKENKIDPDTIVKYKGEDGEDKESKYSYASKQPEDTPAKIAADKLKGGEEKDDVDKSTSIAGDEISTDAYTDNALSSNNDDDISSKSSDDDKGDEVVKKIQTKEFSSDIDQNYLNQDVNPSDEKYDRQKPEQLTLKDGTEPLSFSNEETEFLSGKFPKKYVKVLERIMNSKKTGTFEPNIKSFVDGAGAGQTSSTAGEILTMMTVSMTDEQVSFLEQKLGEHFDNIDDSVSDKDLILDRGWLESAKAVRAGVSERYDDYYGKNNWEIKGSAWDTSNDVQGMGFDYNKKGFSTDAYFSLKVGNQDVLDELSLKKDFNVALSQPGVNEVFYWALATNEDDKKEYDEIEKKLTAVDDAGKKVIKQSSKERKSLVGRKKELLTKYQDVIGKDGNPTIRQEKENKSSQDFVKTITKKQIDLLGNITDDDIKSFSKFNATRYVESLIPRLQTLNPPISVEDIQNMIGNTKNRELNKTTMWIARILDKAGSEEASTHLKERLGITAKFTEAFAKNLVKIPALKKGITNTIREKFPLNALMSGEETMALGAVSADKKVMAKIFGTDNYDEVEQNLEIDGPNKNGFYQLAYRVKGKNKVVNLANLRARQRGLGYSTTPNFEMLLSEDFKGELYRANVSLGREVYDPAKTEKSSMKTKYGKE